MKNNLLKLLFVLLAVNVFSQVGINTASPEATFEVVGKADDINHYDGVIPPRITGDQLSRKSYSATKRGAIVFVTTPPTMLTGQVINIIEAGLYFFDGHLWQSSSKHKEPIEYRIILTFDNTNDDALFEASKWSEPINVWNDDKAYLTSSKHYTIGTKRFGALQGSVTFKKIEGIVNVKFKFSRETDSADVLEDATMDISDIYNEIGYFPTDIAFMHTESPTYLIPIYLQNNTIYIPSVNLGYISSNFIGELQGYSSWIKPHSR